VFLWLSPDAILSAKMKPALLADWDLQHVLAQLHHAKHSGCAAQDSQHKGVFKENPDPASISEYHIGISDHPPPTHLEFQCGELYVSNEGTGFRAQRLQEAPLAGNKDAQHKMQLPEPWWVSSEVAVAAIKKVARQEQEDSLKKGRGKQEQAAGFSSSAPAVKKQPTLAAGTITLGTCFLPQCLVRLLPLLWSVT
jgi:hypothetical protein